MSARRRLLAFPAVGLVAALLWTAIGSFSSASGQEQTAGIIRRAHRGAHRPSLDKPVFLLVLGGDARAGNPLRTRMDSIHVVSFDPESGRGAIVGIPRDAYVNIPGRGMNKINAAGYFGGPELMSRTVEQLSGCRFDYFMLTSFDGFRGAVRTIGGRRRKIRPGLVDEMGGIYLDVPGRGLTERVPVPVHAGPNMLNGDEAISFARNRHERPRGDFDRSLAQGILMKAALAEARRDYRRNPGTALRNLAVLRKHVAMDIPIVDALALGLVTLRIDPDKVRNIVLDGAVGSAGGASIVRITQRGRNQLVDVCSDGTLDS